MSTLKYVKLARFHLLLFIATAVFIHFYSYFCSLIIILICSYFDNGLPKRVLLDWYVDYIYYKIIIDKIA